MERRWLAESRYPEKDKGRLASRPYPEDPHDAWRRVALPGLRAGVRYTVSLNALPNATCAAARRAMGTRYGEQLT